MAIRDGDHRRGNLLRRLQGQASAPRSRACQGFQDFLDHFQDFYDQMMADASARIEGAQAEYDREAGCGRSQGAVWPPPPGASRGTVRGSRGPDLPGIRREVSGEIQGSRKGR